MEQQHELLDEGDLHEHERDTNRSEVRCNGCAYTACTFLRRALGQHTQRQKDQHETHH